MRLKAFVLLSLCGFSVFAQEAAPNNQHLFDDVMYRRGNEYRAASGVPGPKYWQNEASYTIEAELDDATETLRGTITLTYYNNSPQELKYIWMHLEQDRFMENSRGTLTTPGAGERFSGDSDGGFKISNLIAKTKGEPSTKYLINDTRMQVFFNEPLKANGGRARVSMNFEFKIPERGVDRMGQLKTDKGTIYSIAQWYPKAAVYDDINGWNVEPYLGAGEFYSEYGDFDYKITAPYDYIVVGSGELINPKDVLTKTQRERFEQAEKSDKSVYIISPNEAANAAVTRPVQSGKVTWQFRMKNTRDVAFAASKAFVWDAARINLSKDKKCIAQSVYPAEIAGNDAWGRSTEYTKASIEHYSKTWFEYPWTTAINVASNAGGMEYPGMSFCSARSAGGDLWDVTDHEFGHNWFPMIVGTNERRYPWMDEGLNTFINYYSTNEFNNGEYKNDMMKSKNHVHWFKWKNRESIATYPDVVKSMNLAYTAYYKPAFGLMMLREYILGPKRFDNAFKAYIKNWAFKHPQPSDFFAAMENGAGENLNWMWKGWFTNNDNIDLGVTEVIDNNKSTTITFVNKGIPMPVTFKVIYTDGSEETKTLPVEVWYKGNKWKHELQSAKKVRLIDIDPARILPDVDDSDNKWERK